MSHQPPYCQRCTVQKRNNNTSWNKNLQDWNVYCDVCITTLNNYRIKKRKSGQCHDCTELPMDGFSRCEDCLLLKREQDKRLRLKAKAKKEVEIAKAKAKAEKAQALLNSPKRTVKQESDDDSS